MIGWLTASDADPEAYRTPVIVAAIPAAAARMRPPVPALLVAGGTTLALIAGILLVPVLMAAMAA